MTIWEKAVLNIQKGVQRIALVASTFAERVSAEIAIVRLRIRINDIQAQINEMHRTIGRTVVDLIQSNAAPKAAEQLLKQEKIAAVLSELTERKKEMQDLKNDIQSEQDAFKPAAQNPEDTTL